MNDRLVPFVPAVVAGAVLFGLLPAQTPFQEFSGTAPAQAFGTSVAVIDDLDGDLRADVVVGVPGDFTNGAGAGAARVISGATGAVLFVVFGDGAGDAFGSAVGAAGDVDGDGIADWVVGAPGDDDNGAEAGSVTVFSGADASVLHRFDGAAAGDALGTAVAGGADIDQDGYDDVLAGAPGDDAQALDAGAVLAHSGVDGAPLFTLRGDSAGDALGSAVAMAGDVDGDSAADLVVGAPLADNGAADVGMVRLYSGANQATLFTVYGTTTGDAFGTAVAGGGDASGDGVPDILVGAPGDDRGAADGGAAKVLSGANGSVVREVLGDLASGAFGAAVAFVDDIDVDGRADWVAGAPGASRNGAGAGAARAYSGGTGALLFATFGLAAGDALGAAVSGGLDSDGDLFADLLVGAPGDSGAGAGAGAAALFSLRPFDGTEQEIVLTSNVPGARFGLGLGALGDITGDSVPDYAVGAPFEDPGRQGTVRVYSGADHSLVHTWRGPAQIDTWFGNRIANVGDIDQDGVDDVIIGAWHWDLNATQDAGRAEIYSGRSGLLVSAFTGPSYRAHLGSAVGGLGDIDGDGFDDFFIGLGLINNEQGSLRVYSGVSQTVAWSRDGQQAFEWYGWSAANVGDLNGDGKNEIAIGAPAGAIGSGYVEVVDLVSRRVLFTVHGDSFNDLFGHSVAAAGDVNADGVPDILVGAYQADPGGLPDAGLARVFSGVDGALLHEVAGTFPTELFGNAIAGAGDVNGDGHDDFMVGAPNFIAGSVFLAGRVQLFSGNDGRVLATYLGTSAQDQLRGCAGLGDIDGDGLSDLLISADYAPFASQEGRVEVHTTRRMADPGAFRRYGAGCPGAAGALPRLSFSGRPVVGQSFDTGLTTAPPSSAAFWVAGGGSTLVDLTALGAPGCLLHTLPLVVAPTTTDAQGKASLTSTVPANASLVGASVYMQWAVQDTANPLGLITTNAGVATLGR